MGTSEEIFDSRPRVIHNAVVEHAHIADTSSYEMEVINSPKSDAESIRANGDHGPGALSAPIRTDEPVVVSRSKLRLFAVMAALFVSRHFSSHIRFLYFISIH